MGLVHKIKNERDAWPKTTTTVVSTGGNVESTSCIRNQWGGN